jgi:hypothetical protein
VHTAGFRTRHRFHLHLFGDVEGSNTYLVVPVSRVTSLVCRWSFCAGRTLKVVRLMSCWVVRFLMCRPTPKPGCWHRKLGAALQVLKLRCSTRFTMRPAIWALAVLAWSSRWTWMTVLLRC